MNLEVSILLECVTDAVVREHVFVLTQTATFKLQASQLHEHVSILDIRSSNSNVF